jgi:hypothetical protein
MAVEPSTCSPLQQLITNALKEYDYEAVGELKLFARALALSMLVAARPFDSYYKKLQVMPQVNDLTGCTKSALQLLAAIASGNKAVDALLLSARPELDGLGHEFCCYGPHLIRNQLQNFPLDELYLQALKSNSTLPALTETEDSLAFAGRKRLSLVEGRPLSELRYQCTLHEFAKALNVDKRIIYPLIQHGIIPAERESGPGKFTWLDIRDAVTLVESYSNGVGPDTACIKLDAKNPLPREVGKGFNDVVLAILTRQLKGVISDRKLRFALLTIPEEELFAWFGQCESFLVNASLCPHK